VSGLPQLSSAIFSTPKGGVTDVVDADKQSKSAFAAVLNIIPARNAEFAEVQDQVTLKFATEEAARLAAEAAKAAAARLKKGESLEAIAKEYNLPLKTAAPFTADGSAEGIGSGAQLAAAFKANVGESVGPLTIGNGTFVCKVTDKIPADMSQFAQNKAAIIDGLAQQRLQVQSPLFRDSIVADLKKRGKIKLNDSTISRMIGALQG
jgi:peptidyl-prolyl cis-trans isomerase D